MFSSPLLLSMLFAAQQQVVVNTREDVGVSWERVTLQAHPTSSRSPLTLDARTTMRDGAAYLTQLRITAGGRQIPCASPLFNDLPFPQLSTLSVWYDSGKFEPRGDFELKFQYGETPYLGKGNDYVEARIRVRGGRCTAREFRVPEGGGTWRDQPTKP